MSTYLDYSIKTRDQFKKWILYKLGGGLIRVELKDEHLDYAINDAVEEFTKYCIQEDSYYTLNLEDYTSTSGVVLPSNITGLFNIYDDGASRTDGINTLGSVQNVMWNTGAWPAFPTRGGWVDYELAMESIKLSKRLMGGGYDFEYNPRTKVLTLTPDPSAMDANGYIVLGCRIIRDEDYQYGESWVKRYALAECKITLGTIRKKFRGVQMLGGGEIDDSISDEGLSEKESLLQELKDTFPSFDFWVG